LKCQKTDFTTPAKYDILERPLYLSFVGVFFYRILSRETWALFETTWAFTYSERPKSYLGPTWDLLGTYSSTNSLPRVVVEVVVVVVEVVVVEVVVLVVVVLVVVVLGVVVVVIVVGVVVVLVETVEAPLGTTRLLSEPSCSTSTPISESGVTFLALTKMEAKLDLAVCVFLAEGGACLVLSFLLGECRGLLLAPFFLGIVARRQGRVQKPSAVHTSEGTGILY
jgi:hypothetical protein